MSGPKVVRIVTREEIIAACKDILAQLDVEVRRWERVGQRNDVLSDEDITATRKRQAHLRALLDEDRFLDLQKQVPDEISYLQANMAERLNQAAAREANARLQGRRLATLARQTLDRTDIAIPTDLRAELEAVVKTNGSNTPQAERALGRALSLSAAQAPSGKPTPEQEELAKRHRSNANAIDLEAWLKANTPEPERISVRLEGAIEQLRIAGAESMATSFADRHRGIQDEPSKARRQMLADTLMLEVGKALADVHNKAEQLRALEQGAAPLQNLESVEAKELLHKVEVAIAQENLSSVPHLLSRVSDCLDKERKALAAGAQRLAVLSALKDLGYEVREGMETAAPKDGHIVLRRAANPDMGVQITGIDSAKRVQFRPVRFGQAPTAADKSKDRDIETMWCSDFDQLNKIIGARQGALKIEQAHAVGAVPVLFVVSEPSPDDRRPEVRTPRRSRTIE
jgi:hypothetical protein